MAVPESVRETPRAGEVLHIALGGIAGLVGGAIAGAAAFQSGSWRCWGHSVAPSSG